jgi:hypothetical protein
MCFSDRWLVVGIYVHSCRVFVVGSYVPFFQGVGCRQLCAFQVGGWS